MRSLNFVLAVGGISLHVSEYSEWTTPTVQLVSLEPRDKVLEACP